MKFFHLGDIYTIDFKIELCIFLLLFYVTIVDVIITDASGHSDVTIFDVTVTNKYKHFFEVKVFISL